MNLKQCDNFNYAADQYAVQYLYGKERQEFKDWISTWHLKEQLSRNQCSQVSLVYLYGCGLYFTA